MDNETAQIPCVLSAGSVSFSKNAFQILRNITLFVFINFPNVKWLIFQVNYKSISATEIKRRSLIGTLFFEAHGFILVLLNFPPRKKNLARPYDNLQPPAGKWPFSNSASPGYVQRRQDRIPDNDLSYYWFPNNGYCHNVPTTAPSTA